MLSSEALSKAVTPLLRAWVRRGSARVLRRKRWRLVHGIAAALFAVASAAGCGDSKAQCVPGQSIACAGNGCSGHQVCNASGDAFGECSCDSVGSGQFPSTGPSSGLLGAACAGPSNCRVGLECVTANSTLIDGEGPSGGMCLARCLPDHDFCQGLDARSRCVVLSDGGTPDELTDDLAYCLPGCSLGTQPNELDKCRGRVDLVCSESSMGSGVGFCVPACRGDVDCPGRVCNLRTGLCGDAPARGDDIGAQCSAEGPDSCAGGCIAHGGSYAECSGVCSYGTAGCGQDQSAFPLSYYCYLDPATASGNGDLGYCAKLCDCDADCDRPDAVCEPRPTLTPKTGRKGVCGSKTYPDGTGRKRTPC